MGEVAFALVDPEGTLLSEIDDPRLTREDVALSYALAIRSGGDLDWRLINQAIIDRWSLSALKWIKEYAWRKVRGAGS
jgi:hypothetical protein